ncbi:TIR domain-containing protein [Hyphobacterium sp.]|uniref:TIR domain-containing protein n=1 Tax=Hyphobacterium sp. TaxID=2004662 RepID=UPI003BA8678A
MTNKTALDAVNNAVLDLQSADFNTYERPLQRLNALLNAEPLKPFADDLKAGADFDEFVGNDRREGGMVGSSRLDWPTDAQETMGLTLHLIERGAENPRWFLDFAHKYYYASGKIAANIRKVVSAAIIPFSRDFRDYVLSNEMSLPRKVDPPLDSESVFIVHGHDEGARESVARLLSEAGLKPIILHEQPNKGRTIQEKLVDEANVGFAVVLLTPDDVGRAVSEETDKPRARQNVVLELGYFIGRLGRERVCALRRNDVEIPSDYLGVAYIDYDDAGAWKVNLARELKAAGYRIDWDKVIR